MIPSYKCKTTTSRPSQSYLPSWSTVPVQLTTSVPLHLIDATFHSYHLALQVTRTMTVFFHYIQTPCDVKTPTNHRKISSHLLSEIQKEAWKSLAPTTLRRIISLSPATPFNKNFTDRKKSGTCSSPKVALTLHVITSNVPRA